MESPSLKFQRSPSLAGSMLSMVITMVINVKNAVYRPRHVNGKIAQLKQQISDWTGISVVEHIVNVKVDCTAPLNRYTCYGAIEVVAIIIIIIIIIKVIISELVFLVVSHN